MINNETVRGNVSKAKQKREQAKRKAKDETKVCQLQQLIIDDYPDASYLFRNNA